MNNTIPISETNNINSIGIRTINYSIEDGERGILLTFPAPPNLPKKDFYIVDFAILTTLPTLSPPIIKFLPDNPSYTIFNNNNFQPILNLTIRASHNFETQSVIQVKIKDFTNTVIYTDYVLVICSPSSVINFEGTLLSGNTIDGLVNGNSVLRLSDKANLNSLFVGMKVSGPGIPDNANVIIKNFVGSDSADIELSSNLNVDSPFTGAYVFTSSSFCPSPAQLEKRQYDNDYIVLDSTNNWTLSSNNRTIAKFPKYIPDPEREIKRKVETVKKYYKIVMTEQFLV